MKVVPCLVFCTAVTLSPTARAGDWGATVGYNNPPGSALGLSLMHVWKSVALEVGLGSIAADSNSESAGTALGGDIDLKLLFGSQWRGFAEVGWRLGFGARAGDGGGVALGAGNTFVGGGVFYWGSKFLFFIKGDMDLNRSAKPFPSIGFGVRF